MVGSAPNGRIEIVRGRLSDERAGQLLAFWADHAALSEAEARERLADVVCVLIDDTGAILGTNSVYAAAIDAVGGRRFWVYRSLLLPAAAASMPAMVHAAFTALEAEFDRGPGSPIGLCLLLADREEMERHPEAEWVWPPMLYAGYLEDGRQVRIRYFYGARVSHPRPVDDWSTVLDRSYRIDLFAEQNAVAAGAVVDLWTREGAMPPGEAARRVDEVLLVATRGTSEPVAVATVFLQHHPGLRMDLWFFRAFVAAPHRAGRIGWALMMVARDHLQQRFIAGQDTRGSGIATVVEHEGLKQRRDESVWFPSEFTFMGENERGDHVRVRYFSGAEAPPPA